MACPEYDQQPQPSDWPPPVEDGWICDCGEWRPDSLARCLWCNLTAVNARGQERQIVELEDYVDDGDFIF